LRCLSKTRNWAAGAAIMRKGGIQEKTNKTKAKAKKKNNL